MQSHPTVSPPRRASKSPARRVPFHRPSLGARDAEAVRRAVAEGCLGGGGRFTQQVEALLRQLTGASYVLLVTSCTHAMELAMMALGIGPGDEVIVPSFTFPSTATCVLREGARPVFADIDPVTWTLDPEDVARVMSAKTRVIMPVHYAGHPAAMDQLAAIAPPGCAIVEDAAHAFGSRYRGRTVGALGQAGAFSFHATKNLTCGEGGALVIREAAIAKRAESIREKGTNRAEFLRHEASGYAWVSEGSSFVIADPLAAMLEVQLQRVEDILERRRMIWRRYAEALAPLADRAGLTLPVMRPEVESSCHIFAILVPPRRRDAIQEALKARGIDARSHYVPLHTSPYGMQLAHGRPRPLPVTERVSASLLRLPIYPDLSAAEQQRVIDALGESLAR